MYDPRQYDGPPIYSPHFNTPSDGFYTSRSVHSPPTYSHYTVPQEPQYMDGHPQYFYRWLSPPGIVKVMQGTCVLLCFVIFACVISTLVWDMHGYETSVGGYISGGGFGYDGGVGTGAGYYGGAYGYHSSYMTPYSAKSAMISVAAINFIVALMFLVASFSKTRTVRCRRFYLTLLVVDVSLAVLQCIINIIFVIGVNPMAQSSQTMLYNPILRMCQTPQSPSLSGAAGAGFPGAYPMFNQYLHHYCYMDPEESAALVCGILVMVALIIAAFFSYKTRSKIWRHGKPNIYWDEPLTSPAGREGSADWLTSVGSTLLPPAVLVSDKSTPDLKTETSVVSYPERAVSVVSGNTYDTVYSENIHSTPPQPLYQDKGISSSAYEVAEVQWTSAAPVSRAQGQASASALEVEPYESGYSVGPGPATRLHTDRWESMYPEISSEAQRQRYRREFDMDLAEYKHLCAEMDDISDQMNKLSGELDTLEEGSTKFQAVAEEYNRLKDLKRAPDYLSKKLQCKELKQKLSHIKRLVREYDEGYS